MELITERYKPGTQLVSTFISTINFILFQTYIIKTKQLITLAEHCSIVAVIKKVLSLNK